MAENSLVFILDAEMPFVRNLNSPGCAEETRFFNAISDTYLPLLRACTALETNGIPFKFAIAFSPALCEMFADPLLQERYVESLDSLIEFGFKELERCNDLAEIRELVKIRLDLLQLNRRDFVEIYEKNILKKFDYFATHGYLEILATTATSCFLPLFLDIPEAINAQIETGLLTYRNHFTAIPSGFWLPAMAYAPGIEKILRSYGFQYSIIESHGLLFSDPVPETGIFAPACCKNGFILYARDKKACLEVTNPQNGFLSAPVYLDTDRDIGFELDEDMLASLFDVKQGRRSTGFQYWAHGKKSSENTFYQITQAHNQVCEDADSFLSRRSSVLAKASEIREGESTSLVCAFPASLFGQRWHEGVAWFEQLFRLAAGRCDIHFSLPSEGIQQKKMLKTFEPVFSSWHESGYAQEVLNSSNDWMYPFIRKASMRMIDLAERFPDDTGLKERSLNMAARELLLAQSMDWFLLMNEGAESEYARHRFEEGVRAFTLVYESLGSNFISTEWLTNKEKNDNLFRSINYRVFSRKK